MHESYFWASSFQTGVSLASLSDTATGTISFRIVGGLKKYVNLIQVHVYTTFIDSSANVGYIVSDLVSLTIATGIFNKSDNVSLYLQQTPQPLNILLTTNNENDCTFELTLLGGAVFAKTGVTPDVGDTVSFRLGIGYKL